MAKKDMRLIIIGTGLIAIAMATFAGAIWVYQSSPSSEALGLNRSGKTPSMSIKPSVPVDGDGVPAKGDTANSVRLDVLVREASLIYGKNEPQRRSGYLWIDRKGDQMVVTLGALNQVLPGHQLNVYDVNGLVGQVEVLTAFDVISYVRLLDNDSDRLTEDYYIVVRE